MDLMEEIKFYIKDEEEANKTYSRMANNADDAGMHDTARILRGMAADELRHKEMLEGMYYKPEFGPVRERLGGVGYYWEATNMIVGEIAESGTRWTSVEAAVSDAKSIIDEDFRGWQDHHIVIKVFTQSPEERKGITYTPVHTESYWRHGAAQSTPRLFPQTYGDWVNLAEDIKTRDPDSASIVNDRLNVICFEEGDVDAAKRWLVSKAGELGIR